jgi:single-strand DNA-binding protein
MASLNEVKLIGNLGTDPELRYTTGNQTPVCNMSLATTEQYTDQGGTVHKSTEWHRIVVFGRQAENAAKYLVKGRQVLITGKLHTQRWTDKDGNARYTTEIVAANVQYLGNQQKSAATKPEEQPPMDVNGADSGAVEQDPGI